MKTLPKFLICFMLAVISAFSSVAAESPIDSTSHTSTGTIVTVKKSLNAAELEKYNSLRLKSIALAPVASAGASDTTKKVLIIVGVAVVVVGVLALVATHGGKSALGSDVHFN